MLARTPLIREDGIIADTFMFTIQLDILKNIYLRFSSKGYSFFSDIS